MATTHLPIADAPRPLLDQGEGELRAWLAERGQPAMRVKQIRRWLFQARAESFAGMTDLPASLRDELAAAFTPFAAHVERRLVSEDGTQKFLLRLAGGGTVECVLIAEADRRTACVSTQVGCAMGCVFCASGLNGVERNLTSGEIVEQLLRVRNATADGERLSHVVVMGMGEPLANLDNLLEALDWVTREDGLGLSARHVTVSTVGLPAKIRRLAERGKPYHLAVSLHAPNEELRTRIVPTNRGTGIDAVLAAADDYQAKTGRQVTYEYVMLGGVNDSPAEARQLADLLRGRRAHVNLIPFNRVEGLPYRSPGAGSVGAFRRALIRAKIHATVRKRQGADIDAACGQLRRSAG